MNNNLEFENEDPHPDSIENNHPRNNYGEDQEQLDMFELMNNYADDVMGGCTLRAKEWFEKHYKQ
jgi:hypothetical protein